MNELREQLIAMRREILEARKRGDRDTVNMLERLAPRFEIELGYTTRAASSSNLSRSRSRSS